MKMITLYASKGGSGKSMVTTNLAVGLALKGLKVEIIDGDPSQLSAGHWYEDRITKEDARVLADLSCSFVKQDDQLHAYIEQLRQEDALDVVILDTHGGVNEIANVGVLHADLVLTPVRPEYDDLNTLNELFESLNVLRASLQEIGQPAPDYAMLFTQHRSDNSLAKKFANSYRRYAESQEGMHFLDVEFYQLTAFSRSKFKGLSVLEYTSDGTAYRQTNRLCNWVYDHLFAHA